jgi:DNA-directed RNA polymerase subunit RPC12/RpoP
MKIKCDRCWKIVTIEAKQNGPHIQATCTECGQYIKFLNNTERSKLLIELNKKYKLSDRAERTP